MDCSQNKCLNSSGSEQSFSPSFNTRHPCLGLNSKQHPAALTATILVLHLLFLHLFLIELSAGIYCTHALFKQ